MYPTKRYMGAVVSKPVQTTENTVAQEVARVDTWSKAAVSDHEYNIQKKKTKEAT